MPVPTKLSSSGSKKPSAKKTTSSAKPAASATPAALLERSQRALRKLSSSSANAPATLGAVDAALEHCLQAGRRDLAKALADAVPRALAAPSRLLLAEDAPTVATASKDLLAQFPTLECSETACASHHRGGTIARLVRAIPRMSEATGNELLDRCEPFVDGALRGTIGMNGLDDVLVALASLGGRGFEIAQSAMTRWLDQGGKITHFASKSKSSYHASSAELRDLRDPGSLMLAFASRPALVIALLRTQEFFPDDPRVAELIATFDDETLHALFASARVSPEVGEALLRRGRAAAAQKCFDAISARWGATAGVHAVRRRLLLGDVDGAKRLLGELEDPSVQAAMLRVELGLETAAAARNRLVTATVPPIPMAVAAELLTFAEWLLDRDPTDPEIDVTLDAVERQTRLPATTQYDTVNEGARKSDLACFREKMLLARGDRAGAERAFHAHLAELPAILQAVRVPGDRRLEAAMKNDVTLALATGAARAGFGDVATKAIAKIAKAQRASSAWRVAEAFLPAQPDAALHALDALSDDPDATLLEPFPRSLLPAMWAAVLAQR